MTLIVKNFLRALMSQDRAVDNARAAATELSGHRVVRDDVELFLEALEERRSSARPGVAIPDHAREVVPR